MNNKLEEIRIFCVKYYNKGTNKFTTIIGNIVILIGPLYILDKFWIQYNLPIILGQIIGNLMAIHLFIYMLGIIGSYMNFKGEENASNN